MIRYVYDGSLIGLLSGINRALQLDEHPQEMVREQNVNYALFNQDIKIESNGDNANQLFKRLEHIGGKSLINDIFFLFLSEVQSIEILIFKYIYLTLQIDENSASQFQQPIVSRCQRLIQKVQREYHRFQGLLRFETLEDGLLWSSYEPDFNISILLVSHFSKRMSNDPFVICDVGRRFGFYYNGHEIKEIGFEHGIIKQLRHHKSLRNSPDRYVRLWQQYFEKISISQRRNFRLQMSLMPKKYRKYLTEIGFSL